MVMTPSACKIVLKMEGSLEDESNLLGSES